MKRKLQTSFLFLAAFCFYCFSATAQEKAELSSSDQKKIEKADKELLKAEAKYKEADRIYSDVSARQSELTAEESDKMNNKAILKQIESGTIEFNAKSSKYSVYATRVELFRIRNPEYYEKMNFARALENDAKNDFSSAEEAFKEQAKITDNLMRLGKISDAKDFMNKALEKMNQAFDLCANPMVAEAVSEPAPPAEPDTVVVVAVPDTTPSEAPVFTPVTDSMSVSPDTGTQPVSDPPVQENILPVVSEEKKDTVISPFVQTEPVAETPVPAPQPESVTQPEAAPVAEPEPNPAPVQRVDPVREIAGEGAFFRVQIAASRVPLTAEQLGEIYTGSEAPHEELLNEWYKYTIGNFSDYDSAVTLQETCGVDGAFVVRR